MKYHYLACALGWLLGLLTLRGRSRLFAAAGAVSCAAYVVYSVLYLLLLNGTWVLPIPTYVEQCLFPLLVTTAAAGYWGALSAAASAIGGPAVSRFSHVLEPRLSRATDDDRWLGARNSHRKRIQPAGDAAGAVFHPCPAQEGCSSESELVPAERHLYRGLLDGASDVRR